MKKKQWFDDWHYEYKQNDPYYRSGVTIKLPNTLSGAHIISFRRIRDARVVLMMDWLICALDELNNPKKQI